MAEDPALESLWSQVLQDWENERVHGAFLQYCQQTQALPEAAARYKQQVLHEERGAAAEKRLQAVALVAMASLTREPAGEPSRWFRWVGLAVSILMVLCAAWLVRG